MRPDRLRLAIIAVTVAGLAITVALLANAGFGAVFGIIGRIGAPGFVGYCAVTGVVLSVLGLAHGLLAAPPLRLATFIWGRTTREAATDVLPFSQFGGIVVGARSLIARGVPQPLVYASIVADQTTELAAQLIYTLYGVAVLLLILGRDPTGGDVLMLAGLGAAISTGIIIAFALAQRPLLAFAARMAAAILPGTAAALVTVGDTLAGIYRRRRAVVASLVLHLIAWVGSGAGAWIALRLIGVDLPVHSVIVIEGLIFTLRTAAFLVPGAIGLQEGAYVLIAPLFGLPPEAALALSLLKRARDLAIGVPVLVAWQIGEGRTIVRGTL